MFSASRAVSGILLRDLLAHSLDVLDHVDVSDVHLILAHDESEDVEEQCRQTGELD